MPRALPVTEDRTLAVAVAAAHELNEDLTIVMIAARQLELALGTDHPSIPWLWDMISATQRMAWKTSGLLNYSARMGAFPSPTELERLIG